MIIVEGCDAVGKTTLAKWLAEELGYTYHKDSYHLLGAKYYVGHALKRSPLTVLDRFHLGEYVYPVVKQDGREPLTEWQQLMTERILLTKPTFLVLCQTDLDTIYHNFDTRGEDFITKEQVKQVVGLFKQRYDLSILPKCKFNYKTDSRHDLLTRLREFHRGNGHFNDKSTQYESTGNMRFPDVALVGEGYNQNLVGKVNRAFSHLSASSSYLHQALALNQGTSYYITNAMKGKAPIDNILTLSEEFKTVSPSKVIALGNVASAMLTKAGVKHVKTYHPSYWKRFHYSELEEYASYLV